MSWQNTASHAPAAAGAEATLGPTVGERVPRATPGVADRGHHLAQRIEVDPMTPGEDQDPLRPVTSNLSRQGTAAHRSNTGFLPGQTGSSRNPAWRPNIWGPPIPTRR
jgi:hypothetical protein